MGGHEGSCCFEALYVAPRCGESVAYLLWRSKSFRCHYILQEINFKLQYIIEMM